jgi:hypothetical protein
VHAVKHVGEIDQFAESDVPYSKTAAPFGAAVKSIKTGRGDCLTSIVFRYHALLRSGDDRMLD